MKWLMACPVAVLTASSVLSVPAQAVADTPPVWSADFDHDKGQLAAILATIDNAPDHRARGQVHRIDACDTPANACVGVALRKPDYAADGSIAVKYNVNGEVPLDGYRGTTATLRYRVFIPDGTDFRRQGKLPGLSSADGAFGGDAPYAAIADKWSVRLMWLDIGPVKGQPRPSMYVYDQRRAKGRTGEHNQGSMLLRTGQWQDVAIFVHLNAPGTSDGRAEIWLDGALVACRTGLMFRQTDKPGTGIERLAFHNYYGGNAKDSSQFPASPVVMKFDDIAVFDGRATPATPSDAQCKSDYAPNYLVPK